MRRRKPRFPELTVMDLFCGAGGFSEGFRQQGFQIVAGIDHWVPAIETFNYNFELNCKRQEMLDFEKDISAIEGLPDTDVIVGSPPCVSFSMSNRMGSADKSLGLRLMKTYLRIVAIKKNKNKSILKAWFMENVPNAALHLKPQYKFSDLGLSSWAKENGYKKNDIAIDLLNRVKVLNAVEFGVPQERKRLFVGEIIGINGFPQLSAVRYNRLRSQQTPSVALVKQGLSSPNAQYSKRLIHDPIYPIAIPQTKLTDHFYDTGMHKAHWLDAMYLKQNHPYMGRMAFPEDESRPSRTIVASKFAAARETIIYKSERKRKGDGEYRMPTVREAASLTSFPITYQFLGPENTKWALVGNAVSPLVSASLANSVLVHLKRAIRNKPSVRLEVKVEGVSNLNTYKKKIFKRPPNRNPGARFRRHPFKDGNMTVTMSNYDIESSGKYDGRWRLSIMYGTGKGFFIQKFDSRSLDRIENSVRDNYPDGPLFIRDVASKIAPRIPDSKGLQERYEQRVSRDNKLEPVRLIENVQKLVSKYANGELCEPESCSLFVKDKVPKKQLYSLYALAVACRKANR